VELKVTGLVRLRQIAPLKARIEYGQFSRRNRFVLGTEPIRFTAYKP
jgi:hypothetical protein